MRLWKVAEESQLVYMPLLLMGVGCRELCCCRSSAFAAGTKTGTLLLFLIAKMKPVQEIVPWRQSCNCGCCCEEFRSCGER